ncbi:MAG: hypothetical protein JWR50_4130 [Mucilaginibacter sp.]|nr:hypothetical protein [Mucilaginibacter sp.]
MKTPIIIILLLIIAKTGFGQKKIDTAIINMPMVDDRLVYADSIIVKQHTKAQLDTVAEKWRLSYCKFCMPDTLSKDKDPNALILVRAGLEFKMTTTSLALVKYKFYLLMSIKVTCGNNYYSYKVFDIFFVPENRTFRAIGVYQRSPEYLLHLYRKDHMGFEPSVDFGRKKIAEYLTNVNNGVQSVIASLNKSMAN